MNSHISPRLRHFQLATLPRRDKASGCLVLDSRTSMKTLAGTRRNRCVHQVHLSERAHEEMSPVHHRKDLEKDRTSSAGANTAVASQSRPLSLPALTLALKPKASFSRDD